MSTTGCWYSFSDSQIGCGGALTCFRSAALRSAPRSTLTGLCSSSGVRVARYCRMSRSRLLPRMPSTESSWFGNTYRPSHPSSPIEYMLIP
eukprot:27708-Chlamydomonas_euryale.AAC.9